MITEKNKLTISDELQETFGRLTFARLLKASRECDKLSQEVLAKKLRISKATLDSYEKGQTRPTLKFAGIISKTLGYDNVLQNILREDIRLEKLKVPASQLCPKCLAKAQQAS